MAKRRFSTALKRLTILISISLLVVLHLHLTRHLRDTVSPSSSLPNNHSPLSLDLNPSQSAGPPEGVTDHSPWQRYYLNNDEGLVYVYSAYFDDRPMAGFPRTIRLLALLAAPDNLTLQCQLWYSNRKLPNTVDAVLNLTGLNHFAHDVNVNDVRRTYVYNEYTITCPLQLTNEGQAVPLLTNQETVAPSHVTISSSRNSKVSWSHDSCASGHCTPIIVNEASLQPSRDGVHPPHDSPPPLKEFGVCVTNGYGSSKNVTEFVEWAEFHFLLGVSEINLYDSGYTNLDQAFNYYKKIGRLSVRALPHPTGLPFTSPLPKKRYDIQGHSQYNRQTLTYGGTGAARRRGEEAGLGVGTGTRVGEERNDGERGDEFTMQQIRNLRSTALNDCMLRHMYQYRWLVVVDLDEVIVPRHRLNYSDMLKEVDTRLNLSAPHHSYIFTNMYFLQEFPPDLTRPAHLKILRYRSRASPSSAYVGAKSFVDPLKCFNLFNHFCSRRLHPLRPSHLSHPSPSSISPAPSSSSLSSASSSSSSSSSPSEEEDEYFPTILVPVVIGASHHYRRCGTFYHVTCSQLIGQRVRDDVTLKFEVELTSRVNTVLPRLGIGWNSVVS